MVQVKPIGSNVLDLTQGVLTELVNDALLATLSASVGGVETAPSRS
jgi:hypothetical protein